jgi:hypothetical protein
VLLRLVVSWLQPQLLEETAADRRRIHRRAGGSSFDELIDYIRANCQATSKTEPLPTSKTEPPLAPEGRLFSESFRLGLAGG